MNQIPLALDFDFDDLTDYEVDMRLHGQEFAELIKSGRYPISWSARDMLPDPEEEEELERWAKQPGNIRMSKRARFLLMYAYGIERDEILEQLRVSESSLQRWFRRWVDDGIMGLRYLGDTKND